jgi:hypothetical protein
LALKQFAVARQQLGLRAEMRNRQSAAHWINHDPGDPADEGQDHDAECEENEDRREDN